MLSLRQCFDKYGCDRGFRHRYERVYESLFESIRFDPLKILEIGIYKGAGMEAWLEYFPNAIVHGLDTFQRIPAEDIPVLKKSNSRVSWWRQDSRAGVPEEMSSQYDLVFDDALHDPLSQIATLRNYKTKCKDMYFIEDIYSGHHDYMYEQELRLEIDIAGGKIHDLRKGGSVDSVVAEIRC